MVVYAEYLLIENFITGLLLIVLTAKLTGQSLKKSRAAAGAILSGICGFMIFLPSGAGPLMLRILMMLVITAVSLGCKHILRNMAVFLILTFLTGGGVMAAFILLQVPSLSGNGVLYMEAFTYTKLILTGSAVMAAAWWFAEAVRRQRVSNSLNGPVTIFIDDKKYELDGYVDSGNSLCDSITGKPVVLIDRKGIKKTGIDFNSYPNRFRMIPYRAVGTENGMLEGIRVDSIRFDGQNTSNAILAKYDGDFDGFEVLLNRRILEGGLFENDEMAAKAG